MKTLIKFLEDNPGIIKEEDWSRLEDKMKDSLMCRNLNEYTIEWIKSHGVQLIREFHNSGSDINPMEDERQEKYFRDLQEFLNRL